MAYTLTQQTRLLLGDLAGLRWSTAALATALRRAQQGLAEEAYAIQQRASLTLLADTPVQALPADHVQTFALLRGDFVATVRLVDSAGVVWWLIVDPTGTLTFTGTRPVGAALLLTANRAALRIPSPDSALWYLYPDVTGVALVAPTPPAGSIETRQVQLRDLSGTPWYIGIDNTGILFTTTLVPSGSIVRAPDLTVVPLHRMEPEAFRRADPAATTGPPRYYAIEGKWLHVTPTPTVDTACEHLYFGADATLMPGVWHTPAVLAATAALLGRTQGPQVHTPLLAMSAQERLWLQELYTPGDRDALDRIQAREG